MVKEMTDAYLNSTITPLEAVFRSPDWRAGMAEARKKYNRLLKQGNVHPRKVREYLGKRVWFASFVSAIVTFLHAL